VKDLFQKSLNVFLSLSVFLSSTIGATPLRDPNAKGIADEDHVEALADDLQRVYWGQLDLQNPLIADFALDEPVTEQPMPVVTNSPLLDANPFFMRTQNWVDASTLPKCSDEFCPHKNNDGALTLQIAGETKALQINEKFTPILLTQDYIVMIADNDQIFRDKNPGEQEPGEGIFFIARRDIARSFNYQSPVPVFFFATPGPGWTGVNNHAYDFELATTDQVVIYNKDGFGLPIDRSDIALVEKVGRNNLNLAQSWSILAGEVKSGLPLPRPNATLGFGTFLSGQLPKIAQSNGALDAKKIFGQVASSMSDLMIAKAHAHEGDSTMHQKLADDMTARAEQLKDIDKPVTEDTRPWYKRWAAPLVMYGATAAAAVGMSPHIDWSQLITADMPQRIETVSMILGGVLAASVAMKYSVHKALFDKKYPKSADDTWIQKLNKEHKGILDELVHGLWFSMAFLPQGIRHILDFLKDRFFPNNAMIHKAWEATMGYAMQQSSRLAMNWKTFYLGSLVFGMADSMMVAVHLLIFTPFLIQHFGWDMGTGAATAAFASSEVLRNFLAYLQSGAHSYSADVKMIHMKSAQDEAKRRVAAENKDPESAKNASLVNKYTAVEMEKRFKMVGLPGKDEFLYDPITKLEDVVAGAGFSAGDLSQMSDEDKKLLQGSEFVLSHRRWGLVKPALVKALETAKTAYAKSPSAQGQKVVETLEWALGNRSLGTATAERMWDVLGSDWGTEGIKDAMATEVADLNQKMAKDGKTPNRLRSLWASVKGAVKYLGQDSTKEVRDIRKTLFLMSTCGSPLDVAKFIPKSWREKAGSEDAALLAAELFHRAFNAYLATDQNMITPDQELEAAYGARAQGVMDRISRRNPELLSDPFARQVRYWELMSRLQQRDKERLAVLNFKPKAESAYAQAQWKIARDSAQALMDEMPVEEQVAEEWLGLANLFAKKTGEEVVAADWAKSYKYRFIVAQQFAKQVGLSVSDVNNSDFVGKVIVDASLKTEKSLQNTGDKFYMTTLSESDRKFYEAKAFTNNFIESYIDMSVRSDEHLKASSLEYPGIGQSLRRKLIDVPGGQYMTKVVRTAEALFRNEETSYAPGIWAALDRYIPVVPDMFHNLVRNLRVMPYILTMSYLTSYYVWQIHIPYPLWALSVSTGFLSTALVEFNNRLMRNHDIKPMDDVPSKLTYSFMHSNLTNPEVMLIQGLAQPIVDGVDNYITQPIKGGLAACGRLLAGHR